MLQNVLWVAAGGAVGSVLRFAVSLASPRVFTPDLPIGTFLVNVLGSFVIGLPYSFAERESFSEHATAFLFVGLLGAFTTFSAFSLDSVRLFQEGRTLAAAAYILGSNAGALIAALTGYMLGKMFRPVA